MGGLLESGRSSRHRSPDETEELGRANPMRMGRNSTMKSNRMLVRMLFLMVTLCGVALAQDTASLAGTVTDASGAAVQGAQVSLTNSQHGLSNTTSSNGSGDFLFASLPIGSYDLTVTVQGFKKYEAKGFAEGMIKGKIKGELEVYRNALFLVATKMSRQGTNIQDIALITGLSHEEIEKHFENTLCIPGVTPTPPCT